MRDPLVRSRLSFQISAFLFPAEIQPIQCQMSLVVSPVPMALDDFLLEAEDKMSKTEQVVVNEFAGVRTGKASPALVENLLVEVYGSQMRVRELAGITTPEPRTLTIQPWDVN